MLNAYPWISDSYLATSERAVIASVLPSLPYPTDLSKSVFKRENIREQGAESTPHMPGAAPAVSEQSYHANAR